MKTESINRSLFVLLSLIFVTSIRAESPTLTAPELFQWLHARTDFKLGSTETGEAKLNPPFNFEYDGQPFQDLVKDWKVTTENQSLDGNRFSSTVTYSDPKTGLEVRWEGVEYRDYETIEWTVFLKNHGESDTPIISNLQGLDTTIKRSGGEEFILHYNRGITAAQPVTSP
ncbi:MAG: hypothetical protein H6751_15465 [Candidatus Omnitrophica bacterium]|nr:hypothetical protein [Candidatus Omnitrophota bacterium]